MYSHCTICRRNFTTGYNLRRHMETMHKNQEDGEKNEMENSSESDGISDTEEQSETSGNEESSGSSDDSEDSENYTYDEVRAILRYALKSSES